MDILLIFPGFIVALIIVFCYELKIRNLHAQLRNKVHFYVARDKNGNLWLYMGKPFKNDSQFYADSGKGVFILPLCIFEFYLNENDYANIKWEDEPVEVFVNMEEKL